MKYKVGDVIGFKGLLGKIEKAQINNKIGFCEEDKREPLYTIVFEDVPESRIVGNGTDREHSKESSQKKRKSNSRKS